jgi:hypothetical protein
MKLTGLLLGALLVSSIPAAASSLPRARHLPAATASTGGTGNGWAINLNAANPALQSPLDRAEPAFALPLASDRWASGASYQWNAGVNRVVDHLFMPPDQIRFNVTQTGADVRGHYEETSSPNATFAAFEVEFH